MTDAELIAEARKAAPLYGNDWGVLLSRLADRLCELDQEWRQHCQKIHDEAHEIHGGSGKVIGELKARLRAFQEAKPLDDWHEDIGPVLWWCFPVQEPPYVGTPLDTGRAVEVTIRDSVRDYKYTEHLGGWPGYHTHWTPLPYAPREPQS